MFRKKRTPAPFFRQPTPMNPVTGQFAPIGGSGILSRVAMMQVIEEDTHDNYVVCRGFDPETKRFYESLSVAKPYGLRGTYSYQIGQVFAAMKARTRLGDTPGVASVTTGQPADLDEEIDILLDDDNKAVAWIDLSASTITTSQVTASMFASWDMRNSGGSVINKVSCTATGYVFFDATLGDEDGISHHSYVSDPVNEDTIDITAAGLWRIRLEMVGYPGFNASWTGKLNPSITLLGTVTASGDATLLTQLEARSSVHNLEYITGGHAAPKTKVGAEVLVDCVGNDGHLKLTMVAEDAGDNSLDVQVMECLLIAERLRD